VVSKEMCKGSLKGKQGDARDFNFSAVDKPSRGESLQFTIAHMRFPLSKKKREACLLVHK
jgi:hypothetical protein